MKTVLSITFLFFCISNSFSQWKKTPSGTFEDLYDVQIIGNVCYAVGQNSTVLKSSDYGATWKKLPMGIPCHLRALHFIDSSVGFITGENARMIRTGDGGKTWTQQYARVAAYAYDIHFRDSTGIAVGRDMLAIRSDDRGASWKVDTTVSSHKDLNSVCITPNGMCWAVGDSGYILSKHISEKKWKVAIHSTKTDLNHISNIGDSILQIAGGMPDSTQIGVHYNIFLRSTDSGKTWNSITIPEMKTINTAWFFDLDTGLLAGSNGIVCKYYDPFDKRSIQLSGIPSSLNRIFFSGQVGLIAADGGNILRTTNRGGFGLQISNIKNEDLLVYPNPSQGELYIKNPDAVRRLGIYDALGRKVCTVEGNMADCIRLAQKGIFLLIAEMKNGENVSLKLMVN